MPINEKQLQHYNGSPVLININYVRSTPPTVGGIAGNGVNATDSGENKHGTHGCSVLGTANGRVAMFDVNRYKVTKSYL